jgi:hypothetical protein
MATSRLLRSHANAVPAATVLLTFERKAINLSHIMPPVSSPMTLKEILQICAYIILSLGGGGAIVLGLSRYFGQIFADWALAKQKQEYAQMNLKFQNELDLASKRLQVELNRLEHLHKLRTQAEFEKMFMLWKQIAILHTDFRRLPGPEDVLPNANEDQKSEYRRKASMRFTACVNDTFVMWNEEQLAIPEKISLAAAAVIAIASDEQQVTFKYPDPFVEPSLTAEKERTEFFARRAQNANKFGDKAMDLLDMMRKHLQAEVKAERENT